MTTWLSLQKAAQMLGVHPTTLRRWVDNGDVPAYVTPGGHRRFLESDIKAIIDNRLPTEQSNTGKIWASQALVVTQQRLQNPHSEAKWLEAFDDDHRIEKRKLGQRLLGLIMQHISMPDEDESLLIEAQTIAVQYAQNCVDLGLSAAQGLEIIIFFRDSMTEAALQMPQVANFDDEMRLRLMRKLNQIFNLVQIALVKHYQQ